MNHTTRIIATLAMTTTLGSLTLPAHAQQQVCANSRQIPVTSTYLRDIAFKLGIINNEMNNITKNRTVGRSFQEFVARSMNYPKENGINFYSDARSDATNRRRQRVRPDYTEYAVWIDRRLIRRDPHGSFVEVKATKAIIDPNYYYYQILGHIDAVSTRPLAKLFRGASRVLFITTSDTSVGTQKTLAEANKRGVGIWKATVCAIPGDPNRPDLQVGPSIPLNPNIHPRDRRPTIGKPGRINGLAKPKTLPTAQYEDSYGGY